MFRSLFLIAFVAPTSDAFLGVKPASTTTQLMAGGPFGYNPIMEDSKRNDVERARECAENFGECSLEEVENLKFSISKGENFMETIPSATDLKNHLIEEELEKQLFFLNIENTPDSQLFPEA